MKIKRGIRNAALVAGASAVVAGASAVVAATAAGIGLALTGAALWRRVRAQRFFSLESETPPPRASIKQGREAAERDREAA